MGEYAMYGKDRIKIGTCERMYYLRYEQRQMVQPLSGNVKPATTPGLFFRLPFPDEDDVPPGHFTPFERGARLYRQNEDFADDSLEPGTMQLHHPSGLLLNVPCDHGSRLPEVGPGMHAVWNGKSWSLELIALKSLPDGTVRPVVHCRHCRELWSYDWADLLEWIPADLLPALRPYLPAVTVGA